MPQRNEDTEIHKDSRQEWRVRVLRKLCEKHKSLHCARAFSHSRKHCLLGMTELTGSCGCQLLIEPVNIPAWSGKGSYP